MQQDRPKIALVNNSLSKGGAERVQARLSFFFEENGIEVHHILVVDAIDYEYAGKVFNMGHFKNESNGPLNKLKRLNALRKYLAKENFNYIIDFRTKNNFFQEHVIANWIYTTPYVMTIRHFNTDFYFPKNDSFASRIFKKAHGIVTVSKALEDKIRVNYGYQRTRTIYNPLDFDIIAEAVQDPLPLAGKFILGVGRMQDNIKQFDHMIRAYASSKAIENSIQLVLLGSGDYKDKLVALVDQLHVAEHVQFVEFVKNPFPYYKGAYFTALTSKGEGFPNVLLESLASGTPVVSYDCESGPSEIIEDTVNGLLVENQNEVAMKIAMDQFITNDDLYLKCKENALRSVKRFEVHAIGKEWLKFLGLEN